MDKWNDWFKPRDDNSAPSNDGQNDQIDLSSPSHDSDEDGEYEEDDDEDDAASNASDEENTTNSSTPCYLFWLVLEHGTLVDMGGDAIKPESLAHICPDITRESDAFPLDFAGINDEICDECNKDHPIDATCWGFLYKRCAETFRDDADRCNQQRQRAEQAAKITRSDNKAEYVRYFTPFQHIRYNPPNAKQWAPIFCPVHGAEITRQKQHAGAYIPKQNNFAYCPIEGCRFFFSVIAVSPLHFFRNPSRQKQFLDA